MPTLSPYLSGCHLDRSRRRMSLRRRALATSMASRGQLSTMSMMPSAMASAPMLRASKYARESSGSLRIHAAHVLPLMLFSRQAEISVSPRDRRSSTSSISSGVRFVSTMCSASSCAGISVRTDISQRRAKRKGVAHDRVPWNAAMHPKERQDTPHSGHVRGVRKRRTRPFRPDIRKQRKTATFTYRRTDGHTPPLLRGGGGVPRPCPTSIRPPSKARSRPLQGPHPTGCPAPCDTPCRRCPA